jgi:DNA polymerase-3 subunit alpha (Gram-positive type)
MNKGKYFKLKPSDAAHLKLDIKNFVIEHINLFAIKKEMEIIAKINNYDALNEIEDLREVINKKFDNEINLKIKFTIDENILDENLDKLIKFIIENYKTESKRHQFLFSMYEVHSHEKNIFVKLPTDRVLEQIKEMKVDEEIRRKIFNVTNKKFIVKFIDGNFEDEMKKIDKIGEDLEKTVEVKVEAPTQSQQFNQQQNNKPAYSNFRKKVPDMEAISDLMC